MSVDVLLSKIVEVLDIRNDESSSQLDRNTREVITLTHDEFYPAENGVSLDDHAQQERENIQSAKEILDDTHDTYLALPTKFDIHEYRIMERFCLAVQDEEISETLCNAIRGRGAFRTFKHCICRLGIADDWNKYPAEVLREIATDWCETNGIAYKDDLKDSGR